MTMFEGYKETTFTEAIRAFDVLGKSVKCVYRERVTEYGTDILFRRDFKFNLGMTAEGRWFVEI